MVATVVAADCGITNHNGSIVLCTHFFLLTFCLHFPIQKTVLFCVFFFGGHRHISLSDIECKWILCNIFTCIPVPVSTIVARKTPWLFGPCVDGLCLKLRFFFRKPNKYRNEMVQKFSPVDWITWVCKRNAPVIDSLFRLKKNGVVLYYIIYNLADQLNFPCGTHLKAFVKSSEPFFNSSFYNRNAKIKCLFCVDMHNSIEIPDLISPGHCFDWSVCDGWASGARWIRLIDQISFIRFMRCVCMFWLSSLFDQNESKTNCLFTSWL